MKIFLKMSLFLFPILSILSVPVQAMDPEDASIPIGNISTQWRDYANTALGKYSPKVRGRIENSSFWIVVEKTGTTLFTIEGWGAWAIAQWDYMQGTRYSIPDYELAAILCVVGDYKLSCIVPHYQSPYDPLYLVKLHYNESDDQANEDFSASFKEEHPHITEICLVAPNFSEGVALIKDQELSPLEKILKNKGIYLRYGPGY